MQINLINSKIIPDTNDKYLIFEDENGQHKIYSRVTNRVLKDCHAHVPAREYNIKHQGIFKMLGIETIKKMCGIQQE